MASADSGMTGAGEVLLSKSEMRWGLHPATLQQLWQRGRELVSGPFP